MRPEAIPPSAATPPPPSPPRGPAARLERALIALAGGHGRVIEHRERNWASITFAGTRHEIAIAFDTDRAIAGGEELIATLPDHEFAIPGQLVADAQVRKVVHRAQPAASLTVHAEFLLLQDV